MRRIILIALFVLTAVMLGIYAADTAQKGKNQGGTATVPPVNYKEKLVMLREKIKNDADWAKVTDRQWRDALTDEQYRVLRRKGTETACSSEFYNYKGEGVYNCAGCGLPLFNSSNKFESGTGWPSFMTPISQKNIKTQKDTSLGMLRQEVLCTRCGGHLGHVFEDGPAPTGLRYCINGVSLEFVPKEKTSARQSTEKMDKSINKTFSNEAIFAGGCFWGVEHYFQGVKGVISVTSGYTGGHTENPTYKEICSGKTGHAEAVRVIFDPNLVSYEQLAKLFFEIHDPTQLNRQGPDYGTQYRSAVFYIGDEQKRTAEKLIEKLRANGYDVVTQLLPATKFYEAEEYHQDYIAKNPQRYICHTRIERFEKPAR